MALVDVKNIRGEKVSQIELNDDIFQTTVKVGVLHEVVTMQMRRRRAGTASVKRRSDIKGSTAKLFRQKGTGRARRGNIKSVLLRGGGVVFGPSPKTYMNRVPKKVKKLALKMALSTKLNENKLKVLDNFELEEIKTRTFIKATRDMRINNALIVTETSNEKLELSSRNISDFKVMRTEGLNVYDILKYDDLILLKPSIKAIEGRLGA